MGYESEYDKVYNEEYLPKKSKRSRADDLLDDINSKKKEYSDMWTTVNTYAKNTYLELFDNSDRNSGTLIHYFENSVNNNYEKYVEFEQNFNDAIEEVDKAITKLNQIISTLDAEISSLENTYGF